MFIAINYISGWQIMSNVGDKMCRLSTISYMDSEEKVKFSTIWKWYWKDNTNWKAYEIVSQLHLAVVFICIIRGFTY